MVTDATEKRFEADIESFFLSPAGGYTKGADTYDAKQGLYVNTLIDFVQRTQPKEWARFENANQVDPVRKFCTAFNTACETEGLLSVLRHGFKHRGLRFRVCYFKPESALNQAAAAQWAANTIECYRQWYFSADTKKSVDMVLVLNGIPVFAFELKNQYTGQTVDDAKRQWMYDRDPRELCFQFNKRILAYFCVDHTEVWMTTKLAGKNTYFLPFNQGSNGAGNDGGKGNPANPNGYPTAYLWENVFQKDSMMDIVQKFMNLKDGKTLIFPRYHQLDVVRKLLADVRQNGAGHNYLIQHSAGSGKSNSIAWTAYRLASLFNEENKPVFSSVVVVTDRTVLDAQLQETISGFDHTLGAIETIGEDKTSKDLRDAINGGVRIIVTTLQKFPVIYQEVDKVAGRNFAIIVDEAHSSQTGSSALKLKAALADTEDALREYAEIEGKAEEELDPDDRLMREMTVQGRHKNLSFFAFTATPKDKTLELFGTEYEDGSFHPFHIYSMRQAIEEGFILDVLQNYMTYDTCFKIVKTSEDNPDVPASRAAKVIRKYQELHPYNISQKSQIMLADFLEMDSNITVNFHIRTIDQAKAIKSIKSKITDLDKMKIEEQKKAVRSGYDMDIIPSDLATFGGEAKRLLQDLQTRNERLFLVTILIMNTATNRQKLENAVFQTAAIAQKYNCALKRLDFQQEEGLMSSLPIGVNQVEIERGLTTSSTAVFVPFTTQELFQGGEALYYGLNALSNNMIMVDRKQLKNPNGLILGTPGSGKSFSAKREMTNAFLITEDDIIVCDPEAEYFPLVQKLGGQVIRISPVSTDYINPLDINTNYSEEENPLTLKSDFILSMCELIVGGKDGLQPVEKTIIDRSVRMVYQEFLADPKPEKMPILEDLYNILRNQKEPEAQRIATALEIYVHGSLNVFNHRTNVDVNNRFVCYDIRELGKQLKKLGMLIVQDQVWNRVTINRAQHKATRYYMDEFHLLLKEEQTAAYSVEIWKRFRKWGGIPTGITQNVKDLLASREVENIFENSDFVYLLNQASGDRQILSKALNISPSQQNYITNSNAGEGLIFYGSTIVPFKDDFPKDTQLYRIMTTRLEETVQN